MAAAELLAAGTASLELRVKPGYVSARGQAPAHEMEDERDQAQAAGRQRIIKRPRLTRLLDESTSRILMLVAPAGFGKTTLAREWLAERKFAWYRGTPASADVAALAVGLAEAAATIVPGAGERMQDRLRATGTPEQDVEPLAELLAEDLEGWPEDAWIAFDDYQFACESEFSEHFVDLLCSLTGLRLLLTSRVRPHWATARRLLYGELHELGRNLLAMNQDEALEVLGRGKGREASGLVALAEGWPAVIGLAALAEEFDLPDRELPDALYEYFAEELYQAAAPEVQWGLCRLALIPSVNSDLVEFLLEAEGPTVISEGLRLGFLTSSAKGVYDVHPLLRTFLESKFREAPETKTATVTSRLGRYLVDRELWDDAFALVEQFYSETPFIELIELALPSVLQDARLPTLDRWVDFAVGHGIDSPILDLAEAESCFRKGERSRAEVLGLQAAKRLPDDHPLRPRALLVAGTSAHMNSRDEEALSYHTRARELARTDAERWEALKGQLLATIILERNAADLLRLLEAFNDGSAEREVTLATVRFHMNSRLGTVVGAPDVLRNIAHLVRRIKDPIGRASFFHQFAEALALAGRYEESLSVAEELASVADRDRLPFALPFVTLLKAHAELGLRNFSRSLRLLNALEQAASRIGDTYLRVEALLLTSRLYMAEGLATEALEILELIEVHSPARGEYGEYLLQRALTLACLGETAQARRLITKGERHTKAVQVRTLSPCVSAIAALRDEAPEGPRLALRAFDAVQSTGDIDAFVYAYRSFPRLLEAPSRRETRASILVGILRNARDDRIAKQLGLAYKRSDRGTIHALSPRETEVFDLVVQGLSNRQIAAALYISEATAKVHVRHIFEKLGVRNRLEAVLRASGREAH